MGMAMFDTSRLVGTIHWYKATRVRPILALCTQYQPIPPVLEVLVNYGIGLTLKATGSHHKDANNNKKKKIYNVHSQALSMTRRRDYCFTRFKMTKEQRLWIPLMPGLWHHTWIDQLIDIGLSIKSGRLTARNAYVV